MNPASPALFAANGDEAALGFLGIFLLIILGIVAVFLLIKVFYLLACSRCLQQVSDRNRRMQPGMVWLCLIPIFGSVWEIVMMFQMTESLKDEYRSRRMRGDGDFGKIAAILYVVGVVVFGPLALIAFIIHWVKVVGYTRELSSSSSYYDDEDDYDDDDYDRPRRRTRRRDEDDYDDDYDRPRRASKPWDR